MNISKGFVLGVLVTLIAVWVLGWFSCNNHRSPEGPTTAAKSDTVYVPTTGAGKSTPVVIGITPHRFDIRKRDTILIPGKEIPVHIYDPDTTGCCDRYAELYAEYSSQTRLRDTIWLDSLHHRGYVLLTDTIAANTLIGRGYAYTLYTPVITNTVTKKQGLQMLIGGGVAGTKQDPLQLAELNLMLRGKKGGAFGINVKKDLNTGQVMYGFTKLWLVSFKRR